MPGMGDGRGAVCLILLSRARVASIATTVALLLLLLLLLPLHCTAGVPGGALWQPLCAGGGVPEEERHLQVRSRCRRVGLWAVRCSGDCCASSSCLLWAGPPPTCRCCWAARARACTHTPLPLPALLPCRCRPLQVHRRRGADRRQPGLCARVRPGGHPRAAVRLGSRLPLVQDARRGAHPRPHHSVRWGGGEGGEGEEGVCQVVSTRCSAAAAAARAGSGPPAQPLPGTDG